jgi:hypothetical protein
MPSTPPYSLELRQEAIRLLRSKAGRCHGWCLSSAYEDSSPAAPDTHPLNAALATGQAQEGIRGHPARDGELRWYAIDVRPLQRTPDGELYGFVAVLTDVSQHKRLERGAAEAARRTARRHITAARHRVRAR